MEVDRQTEILEQLLKHQIRQATNGNSNGTKLWGLTVRDWSTLIGTVGVPSVFLGAIIYVSGWIIAPPMVTSITNLLDKTAVATTRMADQSERIQHSLAEITSIEEQSKVFMADVHREHAMVQNGIDQNGKKLDTVIECVKQK